MRKKPKASKGSGVSTDVAKQAWESTPPTATAGRRTNIPMDQIIAVKEGTGIVPHRFPRVAPR
jgi:hypothetical protein